jgi:hypothetical protein
MRLLAPARRKARGKGMLTKNLTRSLVFRSRRPRRPARRLTGVALQNYVAVQQKLPYSRANENL